MPTESQIRALHQLLAITQPARISRCVRLLLMEYLITHGDDLPPEFKHQAEDLATLFDFLDQLN